jgi:hypothetical protein
VAVEPAELACVPDEDVRVPERRQQRIDMSGRRQFDEEKRRRRRAYVEPGGKPIDHPNTLASNTLDSVVEKRLATHALGPDQPGRRADAPRQPGGVEPVAVVARRDEKARAETREPADRTQRADDDHAVCPGQRRQRRKAEQ